MFSIRAIFLYCLILVERSFIVFLRGNIVMFLKRDMNFLEMRAISIFHFFQFTIYFMAWMGGKLCLRYYKIVMVVQALFMSAGVALLFYGKDHLNHDDNLGHRALFTGAFCLVGVSHGLQMSTTLKLFDADRVRGTIINYFFMLFLITDSASFIGLTYLDDYMIMVYLGALVLACQLVLLLFFMTDKTEYETYPGPFNEWRVYLDAYFQHLVLYANENIESRKTYKETRKERKIRLIKELLLKRKKLMMARSGPKIHFLDIVIPKYGAEYVNDVKIKWRLRTMLLLVPLIWMSVEMQYSYWMLSVYRMDRVLFLKPPQLILAVNGITNFCFIPVFLLLINSFLKFAKFNTGMHRMVIGGCLIMLASFIGLNNINSQEGRGERSDEPYFNQVKQVVINGISCNLSFNEKVHVEYQQSTGMKTESPLHKVTVDLEADLHHRTRKKELRQSVNYDAYYASYDLDAFVFEWNSEAFFDVVIYFVDPRAKGQMLTVFPYDCKDRAPFDFHLDAANSEDIVGLAKMDIIFVAPPDLSQPRVIRVEHQREDDSYPGLRFLMGNDTEVKTFQVYRENELFLDFPSLENLTTNFYWFIDGDGPNMRIVVDNATFLGKWEYKKGGLYNVVFTTSKGKPIDTMKVYHAEPPFSIHFKHALAPYIIMAIGELMFGLMGLQFFIENTPKKLQYHTMLDWYWALAWSNLIIIIYIHSGLMITFFNQIYWISISGLIAFFFFFYFTFRYPFVYLAPGEKPAPPPIEEPITMMAQIDKITVAVVVAPTTDEILVAEQAAVLPPEVPAAPGPAAPSVARVPSVPRAPSVAAPAPAPPTA